MMLMNLLFVLYHDKRRETNENKQTIASQKEYILSGGGKQKKQQPQLKCKQNTKVTSEERESVERNSMWKKCPLNNVQALQ